MTNAECLNAALMACCLAAIPQHFKPRARFDLAKLPAELRRPAAALMHAAAAFMLLQHGRGYQQCFRWAGADWTLTPWANGSLHIAPCAGGVGLLTRPGTLF